MGCSYSIAVCLYIDMRLADIFCFRGQVIDGFDTLFNAFDFISTLICWQQERRVSLSKYHVHNDTSQEIWCNNSSTNRLQNNFMTHHSVETRSRSASSRKFGFFA